jgi:hypothetical protein
MKEVDFLDAIANMTDINTSIADESLLIQLLSSSKNFWSMESWFLRQ